MGDFRRIAGGGEAGWEEDERGQSLHLLAAVDQALLDGRDALLLLDLLLDLRDLLVCPTALLACRPGFFCSASIVFG